MFAALAIAHSMFVSEGNESEAATVRRYRDDISRKYGAVLIERLSTEDVLRIAIYALIVDPEIARFFLEQAIMKNPLDYRAFFYRLRMAYETLQNSPGATKYDVLAIASQAQIDAKSVLQLIETRQRKIEQRRADRMQRRGVYWERGTTVQEADDAELREMSLIQAEADQLLNSLNFEFPDDAN